MVDLKADQLGLAEASQGKNMRDAARVGASFAVAGVILGGLGLPTLATAQGACRDGYETARCPLSVAVATAPIAPLFAPTGWKTVALDHVTIAVANPQTEAAFYTALMGWRLRSHDSSRAVMDVGRWGSVVLEQEPGLPAAVVRGFSFVISPWNAQAVQRALKDRGLSPVRDDDGKGFQSFHVKDPDGFDIQIGNSRGLAKGRNGPGTSSPAAPAPFRPTGWQSVWLDHLSFRVTDYKRSASFYENLLGWAPTYDEGSQMELIIGDVGDIIIRGGNPKNPAFKRSGQPAVLDHISIGIAPWDTDAVRAELEQRSLPVRVDTSTKDEIHVAAYKSYHTRTPNGFDLQISYVTQANRLALPNAVKPK
ncbi:MAG TPA: VOC family protein [Phenylobacterium sp.]|nr:VOC family protein [Phenylobacterium sp.]